MSNYLNTTAHAGRKPPLVQHWKVPAYSCLGSHGFLLAQSMVRHRFCEGGRDNRNGSIGQ
jgi:hypothetical protein